MKQFIFTYIFVASLNLSGSTYYVSTTGNNSNNGSEALPWATLYKAMTTATAGDLVIFENGNYAIADNVSANSGTIGNYITYRARNYGNVTISGTEPSSAALHLVNKNYLRFIGLNFSLTSITKPIFQLVGCNYIVIDNCVVNGGSSSIYSYEYPDGQRSTGLMLNKSIFKNFKYTGVRVIGRLSTIRIDSCKTYNDLLSTQYDNDGIYIGGLWGQTLTDEQIEEMGANDIEISYHESYNCGRQGILSSGISTFNYHHNYCHNNGATGIQIEDNALNGIVQNNTCNNNARKIAGEAGIWVDDARNIIVRYNWLHGNDIQFRTTASALTNTGIEFYYNICIGNGNSGNDQYQHGGLVCSDTQGVVYNNLFIKSGSTNPSGAAAIWYRGSINNVISKNNIIYNTIDSWDIRQDAGSTVVSDYNIIYNSSRNVAILYLESTLTFADYKAATGNDTHTLVVDPLFIDPVNNIFRLQASSPAINAGANVSLTVDYKGDGLQGLIDIGAYEYIQEVTYKGKRKAVTSKGKVFVKNGKIIIL